MGKMTIDTNQLIEIPISTFSSRSAASVHGGDGARRRVWQTNGTVKPATNHMYAYEEYLAPFIVQTNAQIDARKPETIHFWGESDHEAPVTPYVTANKKYDHIAPMTVPMTRLNVRFVVLPIFGCHITTTVKMTSLLLP